MTLLVALVLVRPPVLAVPADVSGGPIAAALGTGDAPLESLAVDDDNGDDAVDLSLAGAVPRDMGARLAAVAPRAAAMGADPPGVPPPEA